jgi:hypothetical protein
LYTELEKRPIEERQRASRAKKPALCLVMRAGQELALEPEACFEILRECGYLPERLGPSLMLNLGHIPDGLTAAETERFLREHGIGANSTRNDRLSNL